MRKPSPDRLTTDITVPCGAPAQEVSRTLYAELRRVAAGYMRREQPGQTIQATALVHEAYLRLARSAVRCDDERQFIGFAAHAMRQILVDLARARGAQKRWGGLDRVSVSQALIVADDPASMLPALDEALTRLAAIDPDLARLVEFRFFAGLTNDEAADALDVSPATVKRRWSLARAWLRRELMDNSA